MKKGTFGVAVIAAMLIGAVSTAAIHSALLGEQERPVVNPQPVSLGTILLVGNSSFGAILAADAQADVVEIEEFWLVGHAAQATVVPVGAVVLVDAYWLSALGAEEREAALDHLERIASSAEGARIVAFGPAAASVASRIAGGAAAPEPLDGDVPLYAGVVSGRPTSTLQVAGDSSSLFSLRSGLPDALSWAEKTAAI